MDALDRMYRHLVRTIRSRFPQYLSQPFSVTELQQTVLPYRLHRRELGIESNDDYEIALTELLSGARDYLIVDVQMRDALRKELAATNPDPAAFKQFADRTVALSPAALRSLEVGPSEASDLVATVALEGRPSSPASASEDSGVSAADPSQPAPPATTAAPVVTRRPTSSVVRPPGVASARGTGALVPETGDRCRACGEVLPAGRAITYCPHCGQNVTTMNCPACGSELEVGWRFCPGCGRPASAH